MSDYKHLLCDIDARGVATITLNRADVHNAFNDALIGELTELFRALDTNDAVRIALLRGAGKSFSAGADLNMMKAMKAAGLHENTQQALRLATMFETLNGFRKPLIGAVHGAALGGGIGLVAVCDYVLAKTGTAFGLTEVRLGMVPATIGPFVVAKIGASNARATFLSGARFSAERALQMGLIHQIEPDENYDSAITALIDEFLQAGPKAAQMAKALIAALPDYPDAEARKTYTANLIATARMSDEGQEGMDAFLNKRKAKWVAA